ncbi:serine hydrolase [Rhodococcus sp. AW25M09]|uniref:serine hydrolase n=1 Tax=Rhodococcus sp. AW25M09 TaxID=1268303 RepID=UPI00034A5C5F|nr:serine hydrolase [Rhodococcus sp. AW25M09]
MMTPCTTTRLAGVVLAATLTLSACAGTATAPTPTTTAAPAFTVDTSTPVGALNDRILQWINGDDAPDPAAVRAVTGPELAAAVEPLGGLVTPLEQLRAGRPNVATGFEFGPAGGVLSFTTAGIPATISTSIGTDGALNGFLARPDTPEILSFDELDGALSRVAPNYSYSASRLNGGECEAVYSTNADIVLPLGSVFKLYVLGALTDEIQAGTVEWDEQLIVRDATKSAPSGELQNLPDGAAVSVREAAEKMISLSDNTATDLLMKRLGRERVERQLSVMGHHDPAVMTPMMDTRQFFVIGFGDPNMRSEWADADPGTRVELLQRADARPLEIDFENFLDNPASADGVEWFANAQDVCAAMGYLASGPAAKENRRILAIAPGVQLDAALWPYSGFKGGNAPGDLAGVFLATDASGRDWIVTEQFRADGAIDLIPTSYASLVAQESFALLE